MDPDAPSEPLQELELQRKPNPSSSAKHSPALRILTLKEACFLSQEREQSLLREGELGRLTFFIRVPAGAAIRLHNERTGETGVPPLMRIPNVLTLDMQAYAELTAWDGRAHVWRAPLGGSLGLDKDTIEFRLLRPQDFNPVPDDVVTRENAAAAQETESSGSGSGAGGTTHLRFSLPQWTHWKVESPFAVRTDDLFVFESDIRRRFDLDVLPRGTYEVIGADGKPQQRKNYQSSQLQYLNRAASIFWGPDADTDDEEPYPDTNEIVEWLCRFGGFSESLARAAASIIRPDHVPSTRVSKEAGTVRDPAKKKKPKNG